MIVDTFPNDHNDLIYYDCPDVEPEKPSFIFAFANYKIHEIFPELVKVHHLDSTYKVIANNVAYYVLSVKFPSTHCLPIFHFVILTSLRHLCASVYAASQKKSLMKQTIGFAQQIKGFM